MEYGLRLSMALALSTSLAGAAFAQGTAPGATPPEQMQQPSAGMQGPAALGNSPATPPPAAPSSAAPGTGAQGMASPYGQTAMPYISTTATRLL
jgi:hypothetical protein